MSYVELAEVTAAEAWYGRGMLTLRASGTVPDTCWRASLRQSIIEIFPPQYEAVRFRTGTLCLPVVTGYAVQDAFDLPEPPGETIVLHHAGGEMKVEVRTGEPPAVQQVEEYDEAEGRSSRRFDFGRALENAIANLPPVTSPIPDWLYTIEVTEIEAQLGGIAGSHDLVVRVRRARPPARDGG